MRYCAYCNEPMFTSNDSVWIKKKNFDAHTKCKEKQARTRDLGYKDDEVGK